MTTSLVSLARAQPEMEVRSAVNQLIAAGNYSWEESYAMFFDPLKRNARRMPTGSGETEIGGYTTAAFRPRKVVLRGADTAIKLSGGWTLARLLSDEEIEELGRLQWSLPSGAPTGALDNSVEQAPANPKAVAAAAKREHDYTHALPHEVLHYLLRGAKNFRTAGATLAADVGETQYDLHRLEGYLVTGILNSEMKMVSSPPSSIRLPGSVAKPIALPNRALTADERPVLYVTVAGGMIVEYSVEFSRTSKVSFNGQPAEQTSTTTVYSTKIFDVGKTKVEVPVEAKALFLDVATSP